jgi:hypothetical protein
MEGRETATAGQRKAAAYIEDYFKKLKLLPEIQASIKWHFPFTRIRLYLQHFQQMEKISNSPKIFQWGHYCRTRRMENRQPGFCR